MSKGSVVITGAQGQLGVDLAAIFARQGYEVYALGRQELDITDAGQVSRELGALKPDLVVHAAAYTKVDLAESAPDEAYKINAIGSRNVAVAAEAVRAKLVYVSTDYVFDGEGSQPYDEFQTPNPQSVYGRSKLAGERFVQTLHSRYFIVRTSWVYGLHGHNFVKTMLQLAGEREAVSVVMDQIGSPTYTVDLAERICDMAQTEQYGIYHVTNSGQCSWHEFAEAIFAEAGLATEAVPVTTSAFPRPAKRPAYSVLEHYALRLNGFAPMRPWRTALSAFMAAYRAAAAPQAPEDEGGPRQGAD